jgi:hypothetical protein
MKIDIKIYLQNLRKFFSSNNEAADLLSVPGIDLEDFLNEVKPIAIHNYEKDGDPTLDKEQIIDLLSLIEMNILKLGLESLVDEGKVVLSGETTEGKPTFKLTSEGLKDLEESKIFQDTPFGRICLN